MTVAVLDASAIGSFLQGKAPELLPLITQGAIVSEVTYKTLEWKLVRFGVKRKDVLKDLGKLGLDVIEFSERLNPSINVVLEHVKGLEFEAAVAAALARSKFAQGEVTLLTADPNWLSRKVPDLNLKLVGRVANDAKTFLAQVPEPNSPQAPIASKSQTTDLEHDETRV
jgi:hypothetical protein